MIKNIFWKHFKAYIQSHNSFFTSKRPYQYKAESIEMKIKRFVK